MVGCRRGLAHGDGCLDPRAWVRWFSRSSVSCQQELPGDDRAPATLVCVPWPARPLKNCAGEVTSQEATQRCVVHDLNVSPLRGP